MVVTDGHRLVKLVHNDVQLVVHIWCRNLFVFLDCVAARPSIVQCRGQRT